MTPARALPIGPGEPGTRSDRRSWRRLAAAWLAVGISILAPSSALAAPDCTVDPPRARTLAGGQGTLESAIVDRRGHLFFTTSAGGGSLLRMGRKHEPARALVSGVHAPGGLAWLPSGRLLLGFGDSLLDGATGTLIPQAGLLQVGPRSGRAHPYADGLAMANGIVRAPDGTVYASDDLGIGIDRITANGARVENGWATIVSSNGLATNARGSRIFAAQTFLPAAIQRISTADPRRVAPYFQAGLADIAAGFDGIARDGRGNLYVAANAAGEIWRIGRDRSACVLARGLSMPSAVAIGHGKRRFRRGNLYAVGFGGEVVELRRALRAKP